MKYIKTFLFFIAASILLVIAIPVGIVYNVITSLKALIQPKFYLGLVTFLSYWKVLVTQIGYVAYDFWYMLAITIDYLGNAFIGKFIIYVISDKQWYKENKAILIAGLGRVTISSALGQVEFYGKLNSKGLKLSSILNKVFQEPTHCLTSYEKHLQKNGVRVAKEPFSLKKRTKEQVDASVAAGDFTGGYGNFLAWMIWMRTKFFIGAGSILVVMLVYAILSYDVTVISIISGLAIAITCLMRWEYGKDKKGIAM